MKFKTKDLTRMLGRPPNSFVYRITARLTETLDGKALEYTDDFDLESYAHAGQCKLTVSPQPLPLFELGYHGAEYPIYSTALQAWFEVQWDEHSFSVLRVRFNSGGYCASSHYWIIGPDTSVIWKFYKQVMDHSHEIRDEILVFNGGSFSKDKQLYQDINNSRLENLVLAGELKQQLTSDCQQFFASQELYQTYGVPWKRGYLLMGPPGNGKSHAIKALLNHLQKPCIYVQSFKDQNYTDHDVMRLLFQRARRTNPCIVVLEDLDSLLNDGNRSFFLNELDGFAANQGILTLASTNHPERLDPAILERPSRFDRKFTFGLPGLADRKAYLKLWNGKLESAMHLSNRGIQRVAQATVDFSYAYIKELVLSSMMSWIADPSRPMDEVMLNVVGPLRQQLSKPAQEPTQYGESEVEE